MSSARSLSDALVERALEALRAQSVALAFIGPDARCVAGKISLAGPVLESNQQKIFSWSRHAIPMENVTTPIGKIVFFPMPCPIHVWLAEEDGALLKWVHEAAFFSSQGHLSQCRSLEETGLFLLTAAFWLGECGLSSLSDGNDVGLSDALIRYRQDIVDTAFRFFCINSAQYLAQKGA